MNRLARLGVACVASCLLLVATAGPAFAHDPIFIGDEQTTPDTGPFMPDGAISWALYGQVLSEGDTRGFEFDLRDGEELYISLLIPNLSPELDLEDAALPTLELENPDGSTRLLTANERTVFDEQFSRTSYVTLLELREPAQAGRYRGTVTGVAPARFTVAIGETEIFFTETERSGDRPSSFLDITAPLQQWYSTPPGGESSGDVGDVGVDLDLIEEAMDSGEGTIAEGGSLDGTDMGDEEEVVEEAAADEEAATEDAADSADAAEPTVTETETGDVVAEPSDDEVASVVVEAEDGGSSTWVAPVVIGAIAVVGGGVFAARRSSEA